MGLLSSDEYVEQAHFFRTLVDRLTENLPLQELLAQGREEGLASTNLPLAVDFLLSELRHSGLLAPAMRRLQHYFTPFQTYLIAEAENDRGRFDMRVALQVLHHEARYRAEPGSPQGIFLYQFETLCRNRLNYDTGLAAIAQDPIYNQDWRDWLKMVRRQIGIVDFSDMVFVRSEYYRRQRERKGNQLVSEDDKPVLFGEKEGKIAFASRRKDPLFLFAALQRHLKYPAVPRPVAAEETAQLVPQLLRRLERLETRMKLVEEEQREGSIDLSRFYKKPE